MKEITDCLIGRVLESVKLNETKERITFSGPGWAKAFGVEGDCCSSSWIEHLEMPDDISGSTILGVESRDMPPHDGHECAEGYSKPCGHDCLAVYHTVFRTDRGDIVLEYRNDSNGYYGGYLVSAEIA